MDIVADRDGWMYNL